MPSTSTREEKILDLFLQGYDGSSWQDATRDWVDRRLDGGVELVATRSDGTTLAVEHTLIEFFIGERTDYERFKVFLAVCDDTEVWTPGKLIEISVPRDTLLPGFDGTKWFKSFGFGYGQRFTGFPKATQPSIVRSANRSLPMVQSSYPPRLEI